MSLLKWFEKVDAAQARARTVDAAREPIGTFDFDRLVGRNWWRQRLARILFRNVMPPLFALMRVVAPVLSLGRLVIVSRHEDVRTILSNARGEFPVVYGPEMKELGGGVQGVLGLDGPAHDALRAQIWAQLGDRELLARDLARIRDWTQQTANALIDAGDGSIDICRDLITRTATEVCCRYMGLDPHDPDAFGEWGIALSMLLFGDPTGDPEVGRQGRIAATHLQSLVDDAIDRTQQNEARHKFAEKDADEQALFRREGSLLYRLLVIEKMDPLLVRSTIIGLATGFVPTNTLAAGNIAEELFARPALLEKARCAALALSDARSEGDSACEAETLAQLEGVLLEAARLNPALSPGIWRHCPHGGTITRKDGKVIEVASGSILLVSILSALRDRHHLKATRNDPRAAAWLIFGHGPHDCMGAQIALVQITEVFAALLARPGLKRAKGKDGRMWRAGPFPVRCGMQYQSPTAKRALMVIALPVRPDVKRSDVEAMLDAVGNPVRADVEASLAATGCISFASLNVIERAPDSEESLLLVEINGDGEEEDVLLSFCRHGGEWLGPILATCTNDGLAPQTFREMAELLGRGLHHLHRKPWGATGVHFDGIAELSVRDIDRQARLADAARAEIERYLGNFRRLNSGMRAMNLLLHVRRQIKGDWFKQLRASNKMLHTALDADLPWALVRPSRKRLNIADWHPPSTLLHPLVPMLKSKDARAFVLTFAVLWVGSGLSLLAWLKGTSLDVIGRLGSAADLLRDALMSLTTALSQGILIGMASALGLWIFERLRDAVYALLALPAHLYTHGWDILTVVLGGLVLASGALLVTIVAFALLIRWREKNEPSDNRIADLEHVEAITQRENAPGYEQNHILAVMPLKPGVVRQLSFAFVMWGIKQAVTYWFRPGFVVTMGTIHKARWFRIKGTRQFVFFSNYDGSWESYLEDFITRAHEGQTAAWSHGVGFPPTSFLIFDGAKDGDRFKRWVRRQQRVSRVWYSRFPGLTLKQIHRNAMIEDGLARAANDTDARRWLAHFGSAQREVDELEAQEAQSLAFTGFKSQRHATALILRLPDDRRALRALLASLVYVDDDGKADREPLHVSFGDIATSRAGLVFGLTGHGLRKAGLTKGEGLEQLPAAFRMGMAGRQRVLGDPDPAEWRWSDSPVAANGADAVILVYHDSPFDRNGPLLKNERTRLVKAGCEILHEVPCDPVTLNGVSCPDHEHFGFRDGISQPVIRGTRRAANLAPERDIVAAGEFLLGYRNDQGYVSPSVTVGPHLDPANHLPTLSERSTNRFPFFGNRTSDPELRDFGRNGSFLVLRQLDQDVDGFEAAMAAQATALAARYPKLEELVGRKIDADWLSAKVIGRWKDGTSLVSSPGCPVGAQQPDNDFAYGLDDPRGLACPLGAHIRRTNPRDSLEPGDREEQAITNRHRILRRGRSYAYDADGSGETRRGLLFGALCSDLERQFEFVQTNWANAGSFHGLTDEADPLLGHPLARKGNFLNEKTGASRSARFTIPTPAGPVTVEGLQSYVTLRGGGYFFLPSRSAIHHLVARLRD